MEDKRVKKEIRTNEMKDLECDYMKNRLRRRDLIQPKIMPFKV